MSDSEKPSNLQQGRKRDFLNIFLGGVLLLAIIIAVILYFIETDERQMDAENQRKIKHYQAWLVINAAQGKMGDFGRKEALQDLDRDGVSLASLDISRAHLTELNLQNADLTGANLSEAKLKEANFGGIILHDANLAEVDLRGADITRANLFFANLSGANLMDANFAEADLRETNFTGADFSEANLAEANFLGANLSEADFFETNLTGADLRCTTLEDIKNWQKIQSIEFANIYNINNPPEGFIEWAIEHGAVEAKDDESWYREKHPSVELVGN